MKRISLFYVALVAVLFLACKQATPGDKMVELCNEYAEKLDKAQSSSQVDSLRALVDKGIEDILNAVPSDYEPTDEENVAVARAQMKDVPADPCQMRIPVHRSPALAEPSLLFLQYWHQP